MKPPIAVSDPLMFDSLPNDIKQVIEALATKHNQTVRGVLGRRRTDALVHARAELSAELRSHGLTLPQIGAILNRDHSTVIYHLRLADAHIKERPKVDPEKKAAREKKKLEEARADAAAGPTQVTFIPATEEAPKPTPKDKRIEGARERAMIMALPKALDRDEFRTALADWMEYKARRNELYVGPGMTALINKLSRWGADRAIAAIENSMASGYQGIVESKDRVPQQTKTASIIDLCAEAYDNSRNS